MKIKSKLHNENAVNMAKWSDLVKLYNGYLSVIFYVFLYVGNISQF